MYLYFCCNAYKKIQRKELIPIFKNNNKINSLKLPSCVLRGSEKAEIDN